MTKIPQKTSKITKKPLESKNYQNTFGNLQNDKNNSKTSKMIKIPL
jgi:hypothetical protein